MYFAGICVNCYRSSCYALLQSMYERVAVNFGVNINAVFSNNLVSFRNKVY